MIAPLAILVADLRASLDTARLADLEAMVPDNPRRAELTAAAVRRQDVAFLAVAFEPLLGRRIVALRGVDRDEACAAVLAALVEAVADLAGGPPLNGDAPGRLEFAVRNAIRPYSRSMIRFAAARASLPNDPCVEDLAAVEAAETAAALVCLNHLVRRALGDDQRVALLSSYSADRLGEFVDAVYPDVSPAERRRIYQRLRRARSRAVADVRNAMRSAE